MVVLCLSGSTVCAALRMRRLFGGLVQDIKRKIPWYGSDFSDAIHIQCFASFFFIYFACLTPIITFGGLLGAATENNIVSRRRFVVVVARCASLRLAVSPSVRQADWLT